MQRDKFLEQVADYYLHKGKPLNNITFVFPNRRSAMFMRKYLQQGMDRPQLMPRMVSVTYFMQQLDDSVLASPAELTMILYRVYCRILCRHGREKQVPEFDKFHFWGSVILKDFNDVDAYMVDPDQIFKNLKDLKEIRSYFLTDEQKEVIRYLWGELYVPEESERFWEHIPGDIDQTKPSAKFLNLWEIMGELYREFTAELDGMATPLTYSGLQSRRALSRIKEMTADDFGGMRYVFVGFNVLPASRTLIFKRLKDIGVAEFFWDTACERAGDTAPRSSGRFIRPLARAFPMPADFELKPLDHKPEIEIVPVPSNFGQAKVVNEILEGWAEEWKADGGGAIPEGKLVDTAVVMADESLLTPLLHSINPEITPLNITVGISYKSTPFASLMSSIISLHLRAKKRKGHFHYYYQDVIDVLSHAYITTLWPNEAAGLKDRILRDHIYNLTEDEVAQKYPAIAFIFKQIDDERDIRQVRAYIDTVIERLTTKLKDHAAGRENSYELTILQAYSDAVSQLCDLAERYGIEIHEQTFLQAIEHTLETSPLNFIGKPLKGLQMMSVMDTRALDFDNLILTSMNERTFPRINNNPSLIPVSMRAGYHMPTPEHDESTYAYQFYRLLSRARRVRLLYDSRTGGITSGEMSRYLSQLLHLAKDGDIKIKVAEFKAETGKAAPITIDKTEPVIAQLHRYREGGDRNLSASALKAYLSCPLKFYMQYVQRLNIEDENIDYIDAASYGSVLHSVAQDLYMSRAEGGIVNEHTIDVMLNDKLQERALATLDRIYYRGRYQSNLEAIPGEGQVVAQIIAKYLEKMLENEKKFVPYRFEGAEVGEREVRVWQINDKYKINFTMSVDRIDSYRDPDDPDKEALRFIDYKTGSDSLNANSLDEVFENTNNSGIFQLLLYSHAYSRLNGYDGRIKPMIYKFQRIPKDGITDLTIGKEPINDYRDIACDSEGRTFYERFEDVVDRIFEEENKHPFSQTDDINHCTYCSFAQLCGRYPEPRK